MSAGGESADSAGVLKTTTTTGGKGEEEVQQSNVANESEKENSVDATKGDAVSGLCVEPDEKKAKTSPDTVNEQVTPCAASSDAGKSENSDAEEECITIKVSYDKKIYDTKIAKSKTVLDLKLKLSDSTGVPDALQKLMYKGKLNDDSVIGQTALVNGCKVLLIGSKMADVMQVNKVPTKGELLKASAETRSSEPLCEQTSHKKVIEKGKPEDAMVGIKNVREPLPQAPLTGMRKSDGGHVRLTFKLETDELWIGTKERTLKVNMSSIKEVHREAIKDQEEYSIVGIQTGPTVKSVIWVYWVPSQYVDAIKTTILGAAALLY